MWKTFYSNLTPYSRINLNIKAKTIKLEEITGEYLCTFGAGKDFLEKIKKALKERH